MDYTRMNLEQVVEIMKAFEKKSNEGTLTEKEQQEYTAARAYHMSLVKSNSFKRNNISMPPMGTRE